MTTTMTSARYADADGQAVSCELLMWDGRLDNHRELRLRYHHLPMEDRHHGSLACATYDEDGVRGLRRLIGDWSLVLRDRRTGEVVLASDFAGIRPLYYRVDDSNVCWSVSLASLRAHTGVDELDERYIAGFLTHGGSPTLTPYAGIKSVPPGYAVCISRRGTIIRRFWALDGHHEVRYRDERCYDEQLQSLFREAVAARLETTEPVVAELSGGCDSSAVVSMATNLIRSGAVTASRLTTISYVHQDSLDVPFIRAVEAF
jgi:asparagine synthase (glutamine-hydrolysing)